MKALWEWLKYSGRRLQVIGILGPLPGKQEAVDLDPRGDPLQIPKTLQGPGLVVSPAMP